MREPSADTNETRGFENGRDKETMVFWWGKGKRREETSPFRTEAHGRREEGTAGRALTVIGRKTSESS